MKRKQTIPLKLSPSDVERFQGKYVEGDPDECWPWLAGRHPAGYGAFSVNGIMRRAHRVAYALARGDVADRDLVLDHLCRNRACVNPDHLEPVTNAENLLRSPLTLGGANRRKTHCPDGHEYDLVYKSGRKCSECQRLRRAVAS